MTKLFYALFVTIVLFQTVNSARILCFYFTPLYSHQIILQDYAEALANKGHDVVMVTVMPRSVVRENITQIDASWTIVNITKTFDSMQMESKSFIAMTLEFFHEMKSLMDIHAKFGADFISKDNNFDLVVSENVIYPTIYAIKEKLKVPMVGVTSLDLIPTRHYFFGNAINPYLYPNNHFDKTLVAKTFYDRFFRTSSIILYELMYTYLMYLQSFINNKYYPGVTVNDYCDLMLVNTHPALGFTRPSIPTIVDITGIHLKPNTTEILPKVNILFLRNIYS